MTSSTGVPLIHETMPFQNVPAPTALGIRSDASNRNVVFGSCRISIAWVRMPDEAFAATFGTEWFVDPERPRNGRVQSDDLLLA